jgi:hypothetical protein
MTISTSKKMPTLVIEHSVTADMPNGQSLPPFIEDGVVWCVVHRDDGRTLWRRISIQTTAPSPVTDWRAASGSKRERRKERITMGMDMRKYAGEHFIGVEDVRDRPLQVEIAVIKEGKFGRPNLVFEDGGILSLNATNTKILIRNYGPDGDGWVGKEIELTLGKVSYQGDENDSVVIKPISPQIAAKEKTAAAKKLGDELNDDIPY